MSIKDFAQKIKLSLADIKDKTYSQEKGLKIRGDLYIIIMIILVGTASYGLGKISSFEKNKTPISILKTKEYMNSLVLNDTSNTKTENQPIQTQQTDVKVVASKSGTKYYYPWCAGVSRIKEENKIWFNSIEEAKSAGLTPASNCVGLK
jgi:hypothetical protein